MSDPDTLAHIISALFGGYVGLTWGWWRDSKPASQWRHLKAAADKIARNEVFTPDDIVSEWQAQYQINGKAYLIAMMENKPGREWVSAVVRNAE